jgi:hypothetical protein
MTPTRDTFKPMEWKWAPVQHQYRNGKWAPTTVLKYNWASFFVLLFIYFRGYNISVISYSLHRLSQISRWERAFLQCSKHMNRKNEKNTYSTISYIYIYIYIHICTNQHESFWWWVVTLYIAPPTDQGEVRACSALHFGTYYLPLHHFLASATKNYCVIQNDNQSKCEGNW